MKSLKYLIMLFISGMLAFSACSDDDDDNDGAGDVVGAVPEKVLEAFSADYGNVKDVKWKSKNGYYVAHFNFTPMRSSSYNTTVWYNNQGKECMAEQDMDFKDLPEAVREAFESYRKEFYLDWTFDEGDVVERAGMGRIYVIEIERGDLERNLSYSPEGNLLKDVPDEDDDDDLLPIEVPEEVTATLNKCFPGNVLLELEVEKNGIEADIIHEGSHKEVMLDAAYNWIRTEYDVTLQEAVEMLDQAVVEKLAALAGQMGIDIWDPQVQKGIEVEAIEDVAEGFYFEIELKAGGNELEVKVDKEGNIDLKKD